MDPLVQVEYAIEWTAPKDIAGTITVMGQGEFNRERAESFINISTKLPGGQRGRLISRTITWSNWCDVEDWRAA
jgi:hypothetical protein